MTRADQVNATLDVSLNVARDGHSLGGVSPNLTYGAVRGQMALPHRSAVGPRVLGRCCQVDLDRIAAERNGRTRQILGFTTPSQARTMLLP